MSAAQHTDAFRSRWLGKFIDEDGAYGSQCWDVVAKYAREEYGCTPFPTVSGGAEGLWRFYADPIPKYFDKVVGNYRKGDILVWDSSFFPPYGHTALLLEDSDGTNVTVMEQNGANDPDGDGNANGVSYIKVRSLYKINGALRPKGSNGMDTPAVNSGDVTNFYRATIGRDPSAAELAFWSSHQYDWKTFAYDLLKRPDFLNKQKVNQGDIVNMFRLGIGHDPDQNEIDTWNGRDWKDFMYYLTSRPDYGQPPTGVNKASALDYVEKHLQ